VKKRRNKKKRRGKKKKSTDDQKNIKRNQKEKIREVKRTFVKKRFSKNVLENIFRAVFFCRHRYIPLNGNACGESTPWLQRRRRLQRKAERRRKSNFRKTRLKK